MRSYHLAVAASSLIVSLVAHTIQAGVITAVDAPASGVSLPSGAGFTPNDDSQFTALSNLTFWDVTFNSNLDPIQVVVHVDNSGGTTEYTLTNNMHIPAELVNMPWLEFRLELLAPLPTGLNFDTDDGPYFNLRALDNQPVDSVSDALLLWLDPQVNSTPQDVHYELDIPDSVASYTFIIQYTPVVPEPGTGLALLCCVLLAPSRLAAMSHRFSNQR